MTCRTKTSFRESGYQLFLRWRLEYHRGVFTTFEEMLKHTELQKIFCQRNRQWFCQQHQSIKWLDSQFCYERMKPSSELRRRLLKWIVCIAHSGLTRLVCVSCADLLEKCFQLYDSPGHIQFLSRTMQILSLKSGDIVYWDHRSSRLIYRGRSPTLRVMKALCTKRQRFTTFVGEVLAD